MQNIKKKYFIHGKMEFFKAKLKLKGEITVCDT